MLVSREEITIAPYMVQEQDLPSDTVHKSHFERLIKYQEDMDYSYAHKLKQADLAGNHFSKMKLAGARHLFSIPTARGLPPCQTLNKGIPK